MIHRAAGVALALLLGGCGAQGLIGPVLSAAGGLGSGGAPTTAVCVPIILQDAQNLHSLSAGLAVIEASPVTVTPPPVIIQPPPVVVRPPGPKPGPGGIPPPPPVPVVP